MKLRTCRASYLVTLIAAARILSAQEFRLSTGAVDNQVFQQSPSGTADLRLGGTASSLEGKNIEARLTQSGRALPRFGWKSLTSVGGATWSADLKGVPVGGPYTLELRAPGATPVLVKEILVGDLWVLAGQSNMEGVGNLVNVHSPDPRVHSFTMLEEWGIAKEPLHELRAARDPVHWPSTQTAPLTGEQLASFRENRKKGAGLGLPFAAEMVKRTGVPVGLVPCAHGGTSMAQWDPALRDKGGDSLYGSMIRRVKAVGGQVKGVLWYQGESDANAKAEPLFREKFTELIAAVRSDFGSPDLPFYYVQLGRHIDANNVKFWNNVQNSQRLMESSLKNVGVVAANDYELDDGIHVGTSGLKHLGAVRLANMATSTGKPGPRVSGALYTAGAGNSGTVRVSFTGVNGSLKSAGRPTGFSVMNGEGDMVPLIYRTDLAGTDVILQIGNKLPAGATLGYGLGKDPYVNIVDEAGMGMLAFSGVAITP
ncbi:MAG: sialate O-acetylesterase [Bryobacteraceae bacterium]|nr:sialate O-acetylesterase [Bryobacteraceae bacterium]